MSGFEDEDDDGTKVLRLCSAKTPPGSDRTRLGALGSVYHSPPKVNMNRQKVRGRSSLFIRKVVRSRLLASHQIHFPRVCCIDKGTDAALLETYEMILRFQAGSFLQCIKLRSIDNGGTIDPEAECRCLQRGLTSSLLDFVVNLSYVFPK